MDVIFAIGIIVVGLMAVVGLLWYVLIASRLSNDKFTAVNLAQEGVEIVRAIRDTNWVANPPRPWNEGLNPFAATAYEAQYDSDQLAPYSGNPLKIDGNGYYRYNGTGQPSKFTRRIIIMPNVDNSVPVGESLGVVSEVTWQGFGGSHSIIIEDRLYNWQY